MMKQHPVPAALAGLGVGCWLLDRQRGNGSDISRDARSGGDQRVADGSGSTERVRQMAASASSAVSDAAEKTQQRIGEYSDRAQTEFDRLLRENPLALGVVALVVGGVIGMAVPETRRTNSRTAPPTPWRRWHRRRRAQPINRKADVGRTHGGDTCASRARHLCVGAARRTPATAEGVMDEGWPSAARAGAN